MKFSILMISGFLLCSSNNAIANCKFDFNKKIEAIRSDSRLHVEITVSLTTIPEFRELFVCSPQNQRYARKLLNSSKTGEVEKFIVVLSSQSLKGDDYLSFIEYMIELYRKKKVSDLVFEYALIPGFKWNTFLAEHYTEPRVKVLLGKIMNTTKFRSETLDAIMSGDALETVIQMRKDGELSPDQTYEGETKSTKQKVPEPNSIPSQKITN